MIYNIFFFILFFTDESGESETDNQAKGQQGKKPKKPSNSASTLKTQNQNNLILTSYGRKTPIMTTRIHPGTKRISENVRKAAEVKSKSVSTAPTTGQFV